MIEFRTAKRPEAATRRGYDDIYATSPIRQLDSFYAWALGLARARPGMRLLDVSCGLGHLVELARKRGARAVGLDFAHTALMGARQRGGRGIYVTGDAEGLPFGDEAFDRIMNLGSVEHYEAPARAVREMARVLRPTGKAVILLPNAFAYQHALYVWRHGRVYDDGQPLQRYATDHDWRRLLEENGLRVVDTVKYQRVVPRTPGDLLWYLRRPRQLAQLAVSPLVPLHAANCFVYIAVRRS